MKQQKNNSKDKKYLAASLALFQLEQSHGHLKWTVTSLVRKTGISRSLIYLYFGNSKAEILRTTMRWFVEDFFYLSREADATSFFEKVLQARTLLRNHPEAILFYQKWRPQSHTWIAKEFAQLDKKFHDQLQTAMPHLSQAQILSLRTLIHGLVTAPFLDEPSVAKVASVMKTEYLKNRAL